jgi:hypothetical protein
MSAETAPIRRSTVISTKEEVVRSQRRLGDADERDRRPVA